MKNIALCLSCIIFSMFYWGITAYCQPYVPLSYTVSSPKISVVRGQKKDKWL
jgi:hypothetical protein